MDSLRARPELDEGTNGGTFESIGNYSVHAERVEAFLGFFSRIAIQPLALFENFLKERVEAAKSAPNLGRGEDNEVHGKWARVEKVADFSYPFCRTVSALHNDQQIKVAIGCGLAVGVGTEQDDILRAKRVNDLSSDLAEQSGRDWRSCRVSIVSRFDALGI